jgi:hypothetical protein
MLTKEDLKLLESKGIDPKTIDIQIDNFKKGFPFIKLIRPATIKDGIRAFGAKDIQRLADYYLSNYKGYEVLKFVPASGAASRMFKSLFEFASIESEKEQIEAFKKDSSIQDFINRLHDFAFYNELHTALSNEGLSMDQLLSKLDLRTIINYLLTEAGLNYANLPKGLLLFHRYTEGNRMAIEEHLVEGANYCKDKHGRAAVHFTISPEHADIFIDEINRVKDKYEEFFDVIYEITFSIQKSSTDTIAVDLQNKPFRETDGKLLFRPAGHGALIENLNDREGEIIFIKNIDNIVPDRLKADTYLFKRVIGGCLIEIQEIIFEYLEALEEGDVDDEDIKAILKFAKKELSLVPPDDFGSLPRIEKIDYLFNKLNRPLRVCGMVKNEGEPGGGPFWIKNSEGELSLQIVESSQIDLNDKDQKEIFGQATHFNPVDLVCGVRDFKGHNFDLRQFVDASTGFISIKSKDGQRLKAQELPGLWNGAMADWNTIFVEVPIITFNPVKTINDLLRNEHQ